MKAPAKQAYDSWCSSVRDYTAHYAVTVMRDQTDVVYYKCQIIEGTTPTVYIGIGDTLEAAFKRMKFYAQKKNIKRFKRLH